MTKQHRADESAISSTDGIDIFRMNLQVDPVSAARRSVVYVTLFTFVTRRAVLCWPLAVTVCKFVPSLGAWQFGTDMNKLLLALCAISISAALPSAAQERVTLGWGRLFTNDIFGDARDRWRTGSYTLSRIRGEEWTGQLPTTFGSLLEFRAVGETIAPADLVNPDPTDRRYVGSLTFGLHTHFDMQGFETSLGANMVITGPQTGASDLQRRIHDLVGLPEPQVFDTQIGDNILPTAVAEIGRTIALSQAQVRPFVEAQAGAETFVRVGADLSFGGYTREALMLRDGPSGQRYRAVAGSRSGGFSFSLGGDMARVFDSQYFVAGDLAQANDTRSRLRAGVHWQGESAEMFYGVTWLGKEFTTQPDTQVLGSVNVRFKF